MVPDSVAAVGSDLTTKASPFEVVSSIGPPEEWTSRIAEAFSHGAGAVLLLGEGIRPEEGAVAALNAARLAHPNAVLGGRIIAEGRRHWIQYAGYWWFDSTLEWRRENYVEFIPVPQPIEPAPVEWLAGAALMIPEHIWRTVGGFDRRYEGFLSDVDWCLRARRAGFACLFVRSASLVATRPLEPLDAQSDAVRLRSTLLLAAKHSVPHGLLRMSWRKARARIVAELDLVDFWADYGPNVSIVRRTIWFLVNAYKALLRDRLRQNVRSIARQAYRVCFARARSDLR